jgi:6-phosphogluconolactonase
MGGFLPFSSAEAAGAALATRVAGLIGEALADRDQATLVLPGGHSPAPFLDVLFARPLDWSRVRLVLTDERRVPLTSPESNRGALEARRAGTPAAAARLVGLSGDGPDFSADPAALPERFDVVVVGMGADGHVASLFPGQPLGAEDEAPPWIEAEAPIEPRRRLSLSLARLAAAQALFVYAGGPAKRVALDRVRTGEPLPLAALIEAAAEMPEIYWYDSPD